MNKPRRITLLLITAFISACGSQAPPSTPTLPPAPTATPTPKPPVEIAVTECGYGDFGFVTMAGTVSNNTDKAIAFLDAAVALVKNGQVVRTDEVSLVNATGDNAGILHGLDYQSKSGGLAPDETIAWSIAYPLDKLTLPFECEASVTSAR